MSAKTNVFVVGLDEYNLGELQSIEHADRYEFHQLLDLDKVKHSEHVELVPLLNEAMEQLAEFDGSVDAIIGFWDFPVSLMVPYLARRYDLPAPTMDSIVRAEHKHWSRVAARAVIPDHVPDFHPLPVDDPPPLGDFPFSPPFWLKPGIAHSSQLGFKIESEAEYRDAIQLIQKEIGVFGDPYDHFLERINVGEETRRIGGRWCVAETLIGGHQCTLSGYKYQGEFHAYGLVDSINYEQAPSFFYYEYPSRLPERQFHRMAEAARKVLDQLGFDNSMFNVEFFLDPDSDQLWLLEINTRMSQSHAYLYHEVDGVSNHQALVELGSGQRPSMPDNRGEFNVAAKLHPRKFEDHFVKRAPTKEELRRIEADYPGTIIVPEAKEGQNLSDLSGQDSYSYRVALIYTAANSHDELMQRYEEIHNKLPYEFEDPH